MDFDTTYNNLINDNRFTNLFADSEILELFAMEVWNKALESAAESARCRTNNESTSIIVDKQSILSLKK